MVVKLLNNSLINKNMENNYQSDDSRVCNFKKY
jgi:hypothetical protein